VRETARRKSRPLALWGSGTGRGRSLGERRRVVIRLESYNGEEKNPDRTASFDCQIFVSKPGKNPAIGKPAGVKKRTGKHNSNGRHESQDGMD